MSCIFFVFCLFFAPKTVLFCFLSFRFSLFYDYFIDKKNSPEKVPEQFFGTVLLLID